MSMARGIVRATAHALASPLAGEPPEINPAISARGLNGTSQYFTRASVASLQGANNDFAVFAMFKMGDTTSSQAVVSKYNVTGDQREYRLYTNSTALKGVFSSDGTYEVGNEFAHATAIAAGAWKGALLYHDSVANLIGLWFAEIDTSQELIGGVFGGTANFEIGSRHTATELANMDVANCAFLRSPTLSWQACYDLLRNGERGLRYSSLSAAQKSALGLVSYWNNDEQTITDNAADSHGSNALTQTASPTIETGPG